MAQDTPPADPGDRSIPCPACGAPQRASPVTVLRPGDASLLLLFRGKLNQVQCADCHASFLVETPVLYRDDEKRFLVYFLPLKESGKWRDAEVEMKKLTRAVFGAAKGDAVPTCRLTTTRPSFVEKIALHQHDLDDRIVEYLKYQLYQRPQQRLDAVRSELLYDFTASDDQKLAFLVFDRETGRVTAGVHLPMDVYREVADAFLGQDGMRDEVDGLFPGYYVNVDRLVIA